MDKIYVLGLHRAGTHAYTKHIAEQNNYTHMDEAKINMDNYEKATKINNNVVLQCPVISHKTIGLSNIGDVYWLTRNHMDLANSMRGIKTEFWAWKMMRFLNAEWPRDVLWKKIKYDGSRDANRGFVGYYALLVKVKEYFYEKYLRNHCTRIVAEKQPYWDKTITYAYNNPLRDKDKAIIKETIAQMESI